MKQSEAQKKWYETNKSRILLERAAYRKENRELLNGKAIKYYNENKEERLTYRKERYQADPTDAKFRAKKWAESNPEKRAAILLKYKKRRASQIKLATPSWADLEKIKEIYRNCPEGMTVEHKVPLLGKNVSGLHVETNLTYLTPQENSKKGNRLPLELAFGLPDVKTA